MTICSSLSPKRQSSRCLLNQKPKFRSLPRLWRWSSCRISLRKRQPSKLKKSNWMRLSFMTQPAKSHLLEDLCLLKTTNESRNQIRSTRGTPQWGAHRDVAKCNSAHRQVVRRIITNKTVDFHSTTSNQLSPKCSFPKRLLEGPKPLWIMIKRTRSRDCWRKESSLLQNRQMTTIKSRGRKGLRSEM